MGKFLLKKKNLNSANWLKHVTLSKVLLCDTNQPWDGVRNKSSSFQPRQSTSRTISASCMRTGNLGHSLITWSSRNCFTSVSHSLVISRRNSSEMPVPQSPGGKLNTQNIQIHEGLCHISAILAVIQVNSPVRTPNRQKNLANYGTRRASGTL